MNTRTIKYDYKGKFNPKTLVSDNIDKLSTNLVPEKSKLLELGCATGFMSQYFRDKKNCQVYGVEIDPMAVKKARKICARTYQVDLNHKSAWRQLKTTAPYDVIFCSSVIEHLVDPSFILNQMHLVLRPRGHLIITTPNIAHWRMRLHLLTGNWSYQDYGILDHTHLKFFTYYTFQQLILDAGFKIQKIKIDPAGGIKYFNNIAKYFPNLYAHQIVVKAIKV